MTGARRQARRTRPPMGYLLQEVGSIVDERIDEAGETLAPWSWSLQGMITYMSPDFDAPLEEMKEYMK
jgi:hypothetical protein